MRLTTRLPALMAVLLLATAACSDDTTGVTGDPLTQQEAFAIFAELQSAVADALGGVAPAPALVSTPIPEVTGACLGGGTVKISGDVDDNIDPQTGLGTITFSLVESVDDCVVQTTGSTFTVNGAPNLLISGDLTVAEDFAITGTYDMDGGFRYASDDGREGTCMVDVSLDFSNYSLSGRVCGQSVR
ncbi:MAG: hypothetical protein AMS20_09385 [Gemmatimonas sp. SG8_28]|jgi:hypothetical protein|nr:MAG: hypothetical protein AMS20_09385 [Gemmatimonas sp. SG8_28]